MSFTIQRQTKEAIPARLKSIPENAGTVFMQKKISWQDIRIFIFITAGKLQNDL